MELTNALIPIFQTSFTLLSRPIVNLPDIGLYLDQLIVMLRLNYVAQIVFKRIDNPFPFCPFGEQSIYCPQNHGYINIGMTVDNVIAACGQPLSQQDSNQPLMQKIPVQQLIYNNQGASTAFYGVWNVPTGNGGAQVEVDVIDNIVRGIKLNGSDNNAFSLCSGNNIQVGDPVARVYNACGTPDVVNNTYINQAVPTTQKPQIWIYQFDQYQAPISLTFVNGKLQSINN